MRKVRSAVLGVLLSTGVLVAGVPAAPPAAAAVTGIVWNVGNGTLEAGWATASVCSTDGENFAVGQTVSIQVMLGGLWVDRPSVTVDEMWNPCVHLRATDLAAKPGRYFVRALTRSSPAAPLLEARAAVTLTPAESYVQVPEAEAFFLTTTQGKSVKAEVRIANGQRLDLQRKSGSSWVTVSGTAAPSTGSSAVVGVPVPTRAGNATYRVVERATTWGMQSLSRTILIHQTDYAKHKTYLAKARQEVARFCPKTPIYVDIPGVAGSGGVGTIGMAWGQWQGGAATGGWLKTSMALRSGLTGDGLAHTAMHECAHVVQYRAAVEDRYFAEVGKAWGLWPAVGDEGQADCMSYLYTRATERLYYVRGCSTTQLANARRMWEAYGSKYQAAVYTWGPQAGQVSSAGAASVEESPVTTVVRP